MSTTPCTNCFQHDRDGQTVDAERFKEVSGVNHDGRPDKIEVPLCDPCSRAADVGLQHGDWSRMEGRAADPSTSPALGQLRSTEDWKERNLKTYQPMEVRREQERGVQLGR